MTPEELEERRQVELRRLDESEERLLAMAAVGGEATLEVLRRVRRSRERLLGTGPAVQVEVFVPEGATPEEKRQAVIAAVAERLNQQEET